MSPSPTRFDLLYMAATPAIIPWLAARRLRKGARPESTAGMLGRNLPEGSARKVFRQGSLWMHAVSYGEVNAARALEPHLQTIAELRRLPWVISTVTETGQAHAQRSFPQAAAITYWPADYSANVRRFLAAYQPRVFLLLETELWPNFLMLARQSGTQCFLLNGKLSDRSAPRYAKFRGLLRPALQALRGLCVQTELDAEKFLRLGYRSDQIAVTGNCKFDLATPALTPAERIAWLAELGLDPARRWLVAGSTHPGEEELMLRMLGQVRREMPDVGLILCPRHPERFGAVGKLLEQMGLNWRRASAPNAGPTGGAAAGADVLLLDQMGVLARAYGLGRLAIVCGSFCPVGGHNLLEAAAHRLPVLFGPDMHSQREIHRIFRQAGAGQQVTPESLAPTVLSLLSDAERWEQAAQCCLAAVTGNLGSAARAARQLRQWLEAPR